MQVQKNRYFLISFFIVLYALLFYLLFKQQLRLDFSSFYSAAKALNLGLDPYQVLKTTYFATVKKLSANLNPPILLMLFTPLSWLDYNTAVAIWSGLSFMLGLVGAAVSFKIACGEAYYQKNKMILMLIYLALFSTLMNTAIAQLGALLAFLMIAGYHFYLRENDILTALLWGVAIAIKLFPALILFFAFRQQRYRLCLLLCVTFSVLWLLPWLLYGYKAYQQYFHMLTRVLWYGDSWNASLNGYLFRLFVDVQDKSQSLMMIRGLYGISFVLILLLFLDKLYRIPSQETHRQYSLSLAVMLLLSPLGWMYYFSLLLLPYVLLWKTINTNKRACLWLLSVFLINCPIDYVSVLNMHSIAAKLSLYSTFFYGLLVLAIMLYRDEHQVLKKQATVDLSQPIAVILFLSVAVVSTSLLIRLF